MADSEMSGDYMKQKVVDILKENPDIPGLESFTSCPDQISIEQDPKFAEGLVNYLVRVRAADGGTLVAKYSPPYVKAYGPEALLSQGRAELEMTALKLFEEHCPGSAPRPFFYSSKHNLILMEDLIGYEMLRTELRNGHISKPAVEKLAVYLAKLHKATHKDNVSDETWKKLQDIHNKHLPMVEGMVEAFTSLVYIKDPKTEDSRRLKEIAEKRVLGSELKGVMDDVCRDYLYQSECFIHADTHTADILIKGDDPKFIDPEFAHIGPCKVDIGALLSHLIMAYYYHLVFPEENDRHRKLAYQIQDCCYHFLNTYFQHMSWDNGIREEHINKILKGLASFVGLESFRSVCSGEQKDFGACQFEIVEAGIRLLQQHHVVDTVDKLMYIALALG